MLTTSVTNEFILCNTLTTVGFLLAVLRLNINVSFMITWYLSNNFLFSTSLNIMFISFKDSIVNQIFTPSLDTTLQYTIYFGFL